MRDLKADLEVCNRASGESWIQASNTEYPYTIMDETYKDVMAVYCTCNDAHFIAQAREGWPYAIERALEAEKRVEELENQVDILSTTLNMYCSPYYDMRERAEKAEARLEKAKDLIQRWFDGEIGAFGVMDALIIDLEFDIDGIPDEALEYHNIKRKKELLGDE